MSNKISDHLEYLKSLRRPAIGIRTTERNTFSKFCGLPTMPDDIDWPVFNDQPMEFLCQIDLTEIPKECERNGLPESGLLYFFYIEEQAWGLESKSKDGWKVIFSTKTSDQCKERSEPDGIIKRQDEDEQYFEKHIEFRHMLVFPSDEDIRVMALDLEYEHEEEYWELKHAIYDEMPLHQMFGYPEHIQNNTMELECDIDSQGLNWNKYYKMRESKQTKWEEQSRLDWTMLLQLDSDEDVNFMWGDCGNIQFFIKTKDLQKLNFDDVWLTLQCG